MKFRKLFLLIIFIGIVSNLFSEGNNDKGLEFKIKFSNQSIYYLNSNIIYVEASLVNSSDNILSIEIGDVNTFSFDFDVTDTTNLKVNRPLEYVKDRTKNVAIPIRNVSLRPSEKLSIVMNLNRFVKFAKDGVYLVRGIFYPSISDKNKKIESNIITLFLKPGDVKSSNEMVDLNNISSNHKVQTVLKRESLSPDAVVEYMFKARQLNEKEKFFLYLDTESFILNDPGKGYLYKQNLVSNSNSIEEYKDFLWNSNDSDISKTPSKFSIIETNYTSTTGKVVSDMYFDDGNFYVSKRYTFFLKKYDYYWVIYDYIVQNTGIKEK